MPLLFPNCICGITCTLVLTDYFGESQLSVHQNNCKSWRNKNSTDACNSPWLSAKSPNHTLGSGQTAFTSPGHRLGSNSSLGSSQEVGQRSNGEQERSPPWLLAAERRLQQQRNSTNSEESMSDSPSYCRNSSINTASAIDQQNSSHNCLLSNYPSLVLDSQQYMLDKYNSQTNCVDTQDSESQSILQECTPESTRKISKSCSKNIASGRARSKGGNTSGNKNARRRSGIAKRRFSAIELSDDSDDNDTNTPDIVRNNVDRDNISGGVNRDNISGGVNSDYVGGGVTSTATNSISADTSLGVIQIECPLCGDFFPSYIIERHASTCYL